MVEIAESASGHKPAGTAIVGLEIKSRAFECGQAIPAAFTADGANASPAITWSGAPAGTESFALIVEDPDAPGNTWTHWLVWNIPASVGQLPQSVQINEPIRTGINDFGKRGYAGPAPPRGHGPHRYYFRLFALDVKDLGPHDGVRRLDLERALGEHILEQADYMGTYERKA